MSSTGLPTRCRLAAAVARIPRGWWSSARPSPSRLHIQRVPSNNQPRDSIHWNHTRKSISHHKKTWNVEHRTELVYKCDMGEEDGSFCACTGSVWVTQMKLVIVFISSRLVCRFARSISAVWTVVSRVVRWSSVTDNVVHRVCTVHCSVCVCVCAYCEWCHHRRFSFRPIALIVFSFLSVILSTWTCSLPSTGWPKNWHHRKKICNNTIAKDPTAPQVCRYTTLWNVKCLKSNNFCTP